MCHCMIFNDPNNTRSPQYLSHFFTSNVCKNCQGSIFSHVFFIFKWWFWPILRDSNHLLSSRAYDFNMISWCFCYDMADMGHDLDVAWDCLNVFWYKIDIWFGNRAVFRLKQFGLEKGIKHSPWTGFWWMSQSFIVIVLIWLWYDFNIILIWFW